MRRSNPLIQGLIAITTPPVRALGFILWGLYWILFGWWLDKRLVKKGNEKFAAQICHVLPFLFSDYGAVIIPNDQETTAANDFAQATVSVGGLILRFCRGLGEISIDVSSVRHAKELHDFSSVLNLIDDTVRRQSSYASLLEVQPLLRSHMKELIVAFSTESYAEINRRLSDVYAHDRAVTRQWENEINRKLYG
jgi:hypothetical protein